MKGPMFPTVGRNTFKAKDGGEDILVSTIYFSMDFIGGITHPEDHRYYETMIFGGKYDGLQERHPDEGSAIAEHARAVALVEEELR